MKIENSILENMNLEFSKGPMTVFFELLQKSWS